MLNAIGVSSISCLVPLLRFATAQHNAPLAAPALPSDPSTSTSPSSPSTVSLPAALSSAAYIPVFTDNADPSTSNTSADNDANEHSVLNYYFLLLAIFIVVIIVLYWILRRKRKRRFAEARARRHNALAADIGRWPRGEREWTREGPAVSGRWHVLRPERRQEGLDERGEAPPAYVAKPEPAVHPTDGAGDGSPEWIEMTAKPPDYEAMRHTHNENEE